MVIQTGLLLTDSPSVGEVMVMGPTSLVQDGEEVGELFCGTIITCGDGDVVGVGVGVLCVKFPQLIIIAVKSTGMDRILMSQSKWNLRRRYFANFATAFLNFSIFISLVD